MPIITRPFSLTEGGGLGTRLQLSKSLLKDTLWSIYDVHKNNYVHAYFQHRTRNPQNGWCCWYPSVVQKGMKYLWNMDLFIYLATLYDWRCVACGYSAVPLCICTQFHCYQTFSSQRVGSEDETTITAVGVYHWQLTLVKNWDIVELRVTRWSRFMCLPRRYVEGVLS